MYYIKKDGRAVTTNDPNEVTKENFLVEPGAERRVWCKLEKYEYDRETGERITVINQVRADNPGDFNRFVREWKHQGMIITMLHDPRPQIPTGGVEDKLAKLNAIIDGDAGANENQNADANENENKNENGGVDENQNENAGESKTEGKTKGKTE